MKQILIFLLLILTVPALASEEQEASKILSIGVGAGYFIPLGTWADAPVKDVNRKYITYSMIYDFNLTFVEQKSLVGLHFLYSYLNTSEWDDFVKSTGDDTVNQAVISGGYVSIGYKLKRMDKFVLIGELGLGLFQFYAEEAYDSIVYQVYSPQLYLGLLVSGGFSYFLNPHISINVNVKAKWGIGAVDRLGYKTKSLYGIFPMMGISIWI